MSVNVLNARKTRKLAYETGLPIERAVVWSNHDSGRLALCRVGNGPDHVHVAVHRPTGVVQIDPKPFHLIHFSSCEVSHAAG